MASESKAPEYGPKGGVIAPMPQAERGVAAVLSCSPDGKYIIYTNGPSVIVRETEDPSKVFVYSGHQANVKVAKFSPSGYFVASGDETGKVRVWSWTNPSNSLKAEVLALGGAVEDISWGPESKRIAAVGGGASKAKVFMFDTGSALGEVVPLSKKVLSCAMRPCRPMRAVWGGEEFEMQFYTGPPFRYNCGIREHTNFVNCIRYAPDGSRFVSVSSDKTVIIYNGETGAVEAKLPADAMHKGSVYHCAWNSDGTQLVTSSADKTLKVWDMASLTLLNTITIGKDVGDMQSSVCWLPTGTIVSQSLDGTMNFVSPTGDAPERVFRGHKDVIAEFKFVDGVMYSICTGGRICSWTMEEHDRFSSSVLPGAMHSNRGVGVAVSGGQIATVAWDGNIRIADVASGDVLGLLPVGGQPRGVAVATSVPDLRVVITSSKIVVFKGLAIAHEEPARYAPTVVDLTPDGTHVVVGGEDNKLHIYSVSAEGVLTAGAESGDLGGRVSAVAVSPDGTSVAVGDSVREIRLFAVPSGDIIKAGKWRSHTTRVAALAWRPSGKHFVSVSTDRRVCVWDPTADLAARKIDLAHPVPISTVGWQDEDTFWIGGTDGVLKQFAAEV